MAKDLPKPTFKPRKAKNSVDWHVLMTHSSGAHEQIHSFASEEEASQWIENEAEKWLAERQ